MKFKFIAMAAAVAASATAAGAADLNKPAKVAVDYVKVCDAYGAGFFYIPGSDTCLKITGYVYTGYEVGTASTVVAKGAPYPTGGTVASSVFGGPYPVNQRGANTAASYVRADEQFDARTNTSYGLLRSYINFHEDIATSAANSAVTSVRFDYGFVQFAGLTAGRAMSQYVFAFQNVFGQNHGLVAPFGPDNQLAYTFQFGNGVTGTISLEDPTTWGYANTSTTAPSGNFLGRRNGLSFTYGGLNAPDIIANINVTQAWGAAQLAVGAHQDYGSTAAMGTKWGYGVNGGVKFNLPTIATGDFIGVSAAYSVGDVGFADWANAFNLNEKSSAAGAANTYTDLGADATWSAATGIKQTKAFSAYTSFTHYFTPQYEFDFGLGYLNEVGFNQNTLTNANSFSQVEFEAQLQWKPIAQVQISPYVEYRGESFTGSTAAAYGLTHTYANSVDYGLRVRRDF